MGPIVDQDWYLRRHPDVAQQVGLGNHASAAAHYESYGAAEGRFAVPRPPRFVIHIGPHKTGTTYLQTRLFGAQKYLDANRSVYPTAWLVPNGVSHYRLAQLLQEGKYTEIERDIDQLTANHDTVIISSEDLSLLNLRSIDLIGRLLSEHDVIIVFSIRPWPDRMLSLWKQTLFGGGTENLPRFAAQHLADPRMSYVINDIAAIEGWCQVFGRSKVALISYPDLIADRIDIFDYFLETFVGTASTDRSPAVSRAHESPDFIGAEIARSLNVISKTKSLPFGEGYYFLSHAEQHRPKAVEDALGVHALHVHLDDSAPLWDHMRYEMLSRFGDLIIGPSSRLKLKTAKDLQYVSSDHFADPRSRKEIERLWNDINSKIVKPLTRECVTPLPFYSNGSVRRHGASWWQKDSGF